MHINLIKLKIKSKSLEEEAHIIRKEMKELAERGLRNWHDYGDLHGHLNDVVSVEARATFIARAYLRGKDFSTIERYVYDTEEVNPSLSNTLNPYSVFVERKGRQQAALKKAKDMVKKYQWRSRDANFGLPEVKGSPQVEGFDAWVKIK